ncbi:pentatricopeptide repeat-containing protein At5g03800 [Punica granatum]|uniref:DYW domain-containing protein n=2 Tax=Punica granatum TaxID=22663 RepID=A0A218WBT5_PUNGR|nr:pentatricopeptide repeat-containing protein At5g03800 [Punica granatum]OWM69661.1 hypothetical protein CDL15_Pgr025510 [Punica granatum]PKI57658.1 hypothetical protein CRG98_021986 [Punica granatum]
MAAFIHSVAAASSPLSPQLHRPFSLHPPNPLSVSHPKPHLRTSAVSAQFLLPPPLNSPPPPLFSADYSSPPPEPFLSPLDGCLQLLRLSVRYSDVELARALHCLILKLDADTHLFNALISSYLKLGLVPDACRVFRALAHPNVVSYTALISGLAKSGRELEAVSLFFRMRSSGIEPNEYSFVGILTACMRILEPELGCQIHALVVKSGFLDGLFVANALMALYCKCGQPDTVIQLFDEMPVRDISSWNVVISSSVKEHMHRRAMELFREMQWIDNFEVDHFTLSTLLASCTDSFDLWRGREIHAYAIRTGLEGSLSISNALIAFYSKCGSIEDIEAVYDRMAIRDVITLTSMITGFMEFGSVSLAMEVFCKMPEKNSISYAAVLMGLCQNSEAGKVLNFFIRMVERGLELTEQALSSVLKACGLLTDDKISRQIQGFITKFGLKENPHIEAVLLDMCMRCGRMEDAEKMFSHWSYEEDSSVVYTSMICGHARNGNPDKAISLLCRGHSEGKLEIDEVASASALGVCGTLGFSHMGEQIHCHAVKSGILSDLEVSNGLVSMYSKCWNLEESFQVFSEMPTRDITSWNCLLSAHILHRQGDEALFVWSELHNSGINPDEITFLLVISAYRYTKTCLVDECQQLFMSMRKQYIIEPSVEHYESLVGVLSFWGYIEAAEKIVLNMPFKPQPRIWRALLDGCRIHSDAARGKRVVKQLLSMDPQDPSSYVLISNLYSASGRWHCSETVREEMRERGFRKHPARSWVIHENKIIPFYTRDRSHPQSKDIHSGLEILILECLKSGYEPDTSFALQEVEEHQKKFFLFYHSAKLAAAFGLLMTRPGKPVKIVKNILLCGDCHSFLKHASAIVNREILLRDSSGFHQFVNGKCSCRDHW